MLNFWQGGAMIHVLSLEVMTPLEISNRLSLLVPVTNIFLLLLSCSYGGIHGCIGPDGPAHGTHCTVRDVSSEPCSTRTHWIGQQCF